MSIASTNPATQIGDATGKRATLDRAGDHVMQETIDMENSEVLLRILQKLCDIETAIYHLNEL